MQYKMYDAVEIRNRMKTCVPMVTFERGEEFTIVTIKTQAMLAAARAHDYETLGDLHDYERLR